MSKQFLPYHRTGYFSKLICDYLAENKTTGPFYHRFPSLANLKAQLTEKQGTFSAKGRNVLVRRLKFQYKDFSISEATQQNIESLSKENTFTITTGHQLNLFTGPLYFLYKIVSVINLCEQLCTANPKHHFVPVYWMATEDHDFEEINYFNLFGKKVAWERNSSGAVGELSTEGLDEVLKVLRKELGDSTNAIRLISLFSKAYVDHNNLADATRYLGNELFKDHGLVILDGNDIDLKEAFIPYVETELTENKSFEKITETTKRLITAGYQEQVYPREINLFYLTEGNRDRIVEKDGNFYVNELGLVFTIDEIKKEVREHPERFSPNALLRPLYQEVILPNLCYVGGGGELAYWFQLKDYFESVKIPFPVLLLRNSVLLMPMNYSEKLKKLEVDISQLFQKQHQLQTEFTRQLSEIEIDLSPQREHLQEQFKDLYKLAKKTDESFLGAVGAQEKKQLNGLDRLEKRLLKAQKRKLADQLARLTAIQEKLFPNQHLQEREMNFSEFYLEYGDDLLSELILQLDPLSNEFTIIEL
jgi:bacillithiol synthase